MNKKAYEYYTDLAMTKQAWGRAALSSLRPALRQTGKLVNKGLQALAFKAPLKTADQRSTLRGIDR